MVFVSQKYGVCYGVKYPVINRFGLNIALTFIFV
jgi:hypothetical protein